MIGTMKLGAKISGGYAAVLVVTSLVTGYTLLQVNEQATVTDGLAVEIAPQVRIGNEVERAAAATFKEMRSYDLSWKASYFALGMKQLDSVDASLAQGAAHAREHTNLTALGTAVEKVSRLAKAYRVLLERTKAAVENAYREQEEMNAAAQRFLDAAEAYRQRRADDDDLQRVLAMTNQARLMAWKAQALRDAKGMDAAVAPLADADRGLERLRAGSKADESARDIQKMRDAIKDYGARVLAVRAAWSAIEDIGRERRPVADQLVEAAQAVSVAGVDTTVKASNTVASSLNRVRVVVAVGLLMAILLSLVVAVAVTRAITGPVNRIINGLTDAGEQVASASGQVSASSQQLANGASQQASNLEEVSSSLEEVTSMTRQNADNANRANESAKQAAEAAERGASAMARMSEAMTQVKASASETAKIVKTIDEIAFQTNLLALNAAVEAARAGEAGKGFAVVAEEVRNLAMRSAEAAKTTASLIEGAQRNAENGATISDTVSGILGEIVAGATKVTALVAEVASASQQQTTGVSQINTAVGQMDRITQSNAANAEESASASEQLSAQAVEMSEMVEQLGRLVNGVGTIASGKPASRKRMRWSKPVTLEPTRTVKPERQPSSPGRASPALASANTRAHGESRLPAVSTTPPVAPKDLIPFDDESELQTF